MNELQKLNQNHELQLPQETRDLLATIFEEGTAPNTLKAHRRDVEKFWQWAGVSYGVTESYPVTVELIIQFITDHLGGIKPAVDEKLVAMGVKKPGPHKLSTIKRRLYSLSAYHNMKGIKPNPVREKVVAAVIQKAHRALVNQGVTTDKKDAATSDIIEKLIASCDDKSIKDVRDKALILVGFASGGRRRNELIRMRVKDLKIVPNGFTIKMYLSKGDYEGVAKEFPIKGKAADALRRWLEMSKITSGPLFRSVGRYSHVGDILNAKAVNYIFKERAKLAGLDVEKFSAHSLRSGFVTSAASKGLPVWEIMQLTNHRTSRSVDDYYRSGSILSNPASDLL
ncbi:MAG: site-specific integrase [Calditrichaeota bacterium]|jgi:integrase|nr:site-specific integrase [Bacteroidota bacterium]MBT4267934.1 site-specific integrase [Deltaproteobacteria bacterium]MBT6501462.1 site-specific integrase [Deltaproteobacteria bacterium]MBT7618599.1 site-specific integrase [Calditrichota bacterium]MBT7713713.1 site-specific integrase [Deltaproteobacteria bacterium]